MRELKFKAYWRDKTTENIRIDYSEMLIRTYSYSVSTYSEFDKELISVCQFTGLKDKNGVEIYEHDVLKAPGNMSYRFNERGKVRYEPDYGGYLVIGAYSNNQHHEQLTCDVACDCEVIGNVHQNPDLL